MTWRLAHVPASPAPPGGHRAAVWRAWWEAPGDIEAGRFFRLLHGCLVQDRTPEQRAELESALGEGTVDVEELDWERVRNDPRATAEQRTAARMRLADLRKRQAREALLAEATADG